MAQINHQDNTRRQIYKLRSLRKYTVTPGSRYAHFYYAMDSNCE